MKKIVLVILAVSLMAIPAFAGKPYPNYNFQVQDEYADPVDDFTTIGVYAVGTETPALTVYKSAWGGETYTNPIPLASTVNGGVSFFADKDSICLIVRKTNTPNVKYDPFLQTNHRVISFQQAVTTQRFTECDMFFDVATAESATILINDIIDNCGSGTVPNASMDVPRNINIVLYTYGNANAGCTGAIGIYGVSANGSTISESLVIGSLVIANSITTKVTLKAFARVDTISVDATVRTMAGASDTMTAGFGPSLGLKRDAHGDTIFKAWEAGSNVSPTSLTFDSLNNVITPGSAPNATRDYIYYYKSKQLILIDTNSK